MTDPTRLVASPAARAAAIRAFGRSGVPEAQRPTYWRTFHGRYRTTSTAGDVIHRDRCAVISREYACLPWRELDGQPLSAVLESVAVDDLLSLCAVCLSPTPSPDPRPLPGARVSEIALPTRSAAPAPLTFDQQLVFADKMAKATSLPPAYRDNPGNLLFAAQMAEMFGLHPITVIRYADFVEGRLTPGADLQVALVRRAGHRIKVRTDGDGDTLRAICEIVRNDDPEPTRVVWTMDDAKRADLARKAVWQKYARRMLKHRAVTEAVSDACSEVLMGLDIPVDFDATSSMLGVEDADAATPAVEDDIADAEIVEPSSYTLRGNVWREAGRLWPNLNADERLAEVEGEFAGMFDGAALRDASLEQLAAFGRDLAARIPATDA